MSYLKVLWRRVLAMSFRHIALIMRVVVLFVYNVSLFRFLVSVFIWVSSLIKVRSDGGMRIRVDRYLIGDKVDLTVYSGRNMWVPKIPVFWSRQS